MDIHNYQKRYEGTCQRITNSNDISDENKKLIFEFRDYLLSEGIGPSKIERYLSDIMKLNKMLSKPFSEAIEQDLRRVVGHLNQTNLSEETKKTFKIMLRKFYRFLRGIHKKGVYPPEVEWISIAIPNNHKKLPEELLTEEEIVKIIQHCQTIRDKALISALAESGCRVSEVGTMRIKHVSFEEHGARLTVNGKTGMRKILVINSSPYLQEWINQHPSNEDPDSFLWAGENTRAIGYARIMAILKTAGKRAGIKKRLYLHLLRHSRATILANRMSDSALKHYLGWTQASKMAGIYIHMSGKETDETILEMNGIKVEKERKESPLKPKKCVKCKTVNEATNKFCKICGMVLEKKEANKIIENDLKRTQADEIMNRLMNDSEILELIRKKILH
jgi:site-specific recombinase XerD